MELSTKIALTAFCALMSLLPALAKGIESTARPPQIFPAQEHITGKSLGNHDMFVERRPGKPDYEHLQASAECHDQNMKGQAFLKLGNMQEAGIAFQNALNADPSNIIALRGLALCYISLGDTTRAIEAERGAVYASNQGEQFIRETNTANLMRFASLLDKAGQTAEAMTVYNHGASLLKYTDNKPNDGYLLPLFGAEQGQIAYTPARLQALTQVGMGIDSLYTQELTPAERLMHLKEAARLYPDSPVVQSYLGDVLAGSGDAAGAKAARAQANALGLSRVRGLLDAQTAIMQEQKGVK